MKNNGNSGIPGKCQLCGSYEYLERHHLVPRAVQRERGVSGYFEYYVMLVCGRCHASLHNALITQLNLNKRYRAIDIFNSERYQLLTNWLRKEYPVIFKGWEEHFKAFINDSFEKLDNDE